MALSSVITACAYSAPASRASPQNVERPGWGFAKHGGFPPLPWGASGRPQDSTAVYFAGNASGLNNASEAAAQARFGIVGIGWQLNNQGSDFRHESKWEEMTARQLKSLRPGVRTMVLSLIHISEPTRPY